MWKETDVISLNHVCYVAPNFKNIIASKCGQYTNYWDILHYFIHTKSLESGTCFILIEHSCSGDKILMVKVKCNSKSKKLCLIEYFTSIQFLNLNLLTWNKIKSAVPHSY